MPILAKVAPSNGMQRTALRTAADVRIRQTGGSMKLEYAKRLDEQDHRSLVLWAVDCAEHVLPYFEEKYPEETTDLGKLSKQGVPGCVVR